MAPQPPLVDAYNDAITLSMCANNGLRPLTPSGLFTQLYPMFDKWCTVLDSK